MNYQSKQPIVLIGGASGTGKTVLGNELSKRLRIPLMQADDIRIAMQVAERHNRNAIVNFFKHKNHFKAYSARQLSKFHEKVSGEVCCAIQEIVMHHHLTNLPVIIEGDDLIPQFLKKATRIHKSIKAFVLHQPDEDSLRESIIRRNRNMNNPVIRETSIRLAIEDNRRIAIKARSLDVRLIPVRPIRELVKVVSGEIGAR